MEILLFKRRQKLREPSRRPRHRDSSARNTFFRAGDICRSSNSGTPSSPASARRCAVSLRSLMNNPGLGALELRDHLIGKPLDAIQTICQLELLGVVDTPG